MWFYLRTPGGVFLLPLCLFVWLFVLSVLIYQHLTNPRTMGQRHSSPTPLSLVTDNFKVKMRAHDVSVEIKRNKLITFCSAEWPTFHVGWPSEGTFDLGTVRRVWDIIFRPRIGHPDQVPFVSTCVSSDISECWTRAQFRALEGVPLPATNGDSGGDSSSPRLTS